jgi:hypothetical protein
MIQLPKTLQEEIPMQLSIPEINSSVLHFNISLRKVNTSIVLDDLYADLVIDYFYEINIEYDGDGKYGEKSTFCILLSQKICPSEFEFIPYGESNVMSILFECHQSCTGIQIVEGSINERSGVFMLIGVRDDKNNEDSVLVLLLKK